MVAYVIGNERKKYRLTGFLPLETAKNFAGYLARSIYPDKREEITILEFDGVKVSTIQLVDFCKQHNIKMEG